MASDATAERAMSEYDCPSCKKFCEFQLPSNTAMIMRGLYAGVTKPSRALGLLSHS